MRQWQSEESPTTKGRTSEVALPPKALKRSTDEKPPIEKGYRIRKMGAETRQRARLGAMRKATKVSKLYSSRLVQRNKNKKNGQVLAVVWASESRCDAAENQIRCRNGRPNDPSVR